MRVSECLLFRKVDGVMKIYELRKKLLNLLCSNLILDLIFRFVKGTSQ